MGIDEKYIDALKKIKQFEDTVDKQEWQIGWDWVQVAVAQSTINKLLTMDLVKRTFSSNRTKAHMLTEKAIAFLAGYSETEESTTKSTIEPTESTKSTDSNISIDIVELEHITQHMFDDIVGYDDLKELVRESLLTDKPIHILLVGPPALAKSLILFDIEKVMPHHAMWIVGSATSKSGLWDDLAQRRPHVLLIDELDKMTATDTSALLSLMEKGRLVRTKVGRKLDIQLDVWVVGSANRITKMAPELLSRFKVYQIKEYGATDFREVVGRALQIHESVDEQIADEIALRLVNRTKDVRDAIRVARLAKRVGVQRAVELLMD